LDEYSEVVVVNLRAQRTHPRRLLSLAHIKRAFDAISNLVGVVGIEQQRVRQLFDSTGFMS
jgi:hypothetical protein